MEEDTAASSTPGFVEDASRKWQYVLDKSAPHMLYRWILFVVVFLIYFSRVYFLQGWFIVTYGLGIFLLNQLIGFLSPQVSGAIDMATHAFVSRVAAAATRW
jgi:hypothetical protein